MLTCMRTTVRLSEPLFAEAKKYAARTGRTFTALLEDAVRVLIETERRSRKGRPKTLPVYGEGGPRSGVDLDSSADLLSVMERPDGDR